MKIVVETYRLLNKMGPYKAYTTVEIVEMTGKQRCAVLKRLHRLENAGFLEKRLGPDGGFYWKVIQLPEAPEPPKMWKEPKSIYELTGTSPPNIEDDEETEGTDDNTVSDHSATSLNE